MPLATEYYQTVSNASSRLIFRLGF